MELIHGHKDRTEQRKADKREKRKARYREIMLEGSEPGKVFHAATRWYSMRDKWETDSKAEFILYSAMVKLLAQEFTPAWVAREFPAIKEYRGHTYGAKDYTTSMRALRESVAFDGDEDKANDFLWQWDNHWIMGFIIAGITIVDELRAGMGQRSLCEEWASDMGIKVYHSTKVEGGKEIMLDEDGRALGVVKHRHSHLKAIR